MTDSIFHNRLLDDLPMIPATEPLVYEAKTRLPVLSWREPTDDERSLAAVMAGHRPDF